MSLVRNCDGSCHFWDLPVMWKQKSCHLGNSCTSSSSSFSILTTGEDNPGSLDSTDAAKPGSGSVEVMSLLKIMKNISCHILGSHFTSAWYVPRGLLITFTCLTGCIRCQLPKVPWYQAALFYLCRPTTV